MKVDIYKLVVSLVIPFIAAAVGSLATSPAIPTWYATLVKPVWTPPNWLFGPVWTTLYILMGISFYLVWLKGSGRWAKLKGWLGIKQPKAPVYAYGIQLVLNALWSVLFFGLQSPLLGLVGIVFLWFSIAITIGLFYNVDRRAAWLLVPYIVWVTIAANLNMFVWVLNI